METPTPPIRRGAVGGSKDEERSWTRLRGVSHREYAQALTNQPFSVVGHSTLLPGTGYRGQTKRQEGREESLLGEDP